MRIEEWFVPKFGSLRFRVFVGMLFLPYTAVCISYTIIGSMLAQDLHWDRVYAIAIIYFLGLGISAHILDALYSKKKPWGELSELFNKGHLLTLAIISLIIAYTIGIFYILTYKLLVLAVIAILEGFFLFAYNLELFKGIFHNNVSFTFSWGFLPLLAGYHIQTNQISMLAIVIAILTSLLSYAEIRVSRIYKKLKMARKYTKGYETILKCICIIAISSAAIAVLIRLLLW